MFKSEIGFYDYHATDQIAERSAIIAFLAKITANKSAKTEIEYFFNDNDIAMLDFW